MNLSTDTVSIRTPFNRKPVKSTPETRRVLVNGRWQRIDPQAATVWRFLKGLS